MGRPNWLVPLVLLLWSHKPATHLSFSPQKKNKNKHKNKKVFLHFLPHTKWDLTDGLCKRFWGSIDVKFQLVALQETHPVKSTASWALAVIKRSFRVTLPYFSKNFRRNFAEQHLSINWSLRLRVVSADRRIDQPSPHYFEWFGETSVSRKVP